jgi:hypothetical protein
MYVSVFGTPQSSLAHEAIIVTIVAIIIFFFLIFTIFTSVTVTATSRDAFRHTADVAILILVLALTVSVKPPSVLRPRLLFRFTLVPVRGPGTSIEVQTFLRMEVILVLNPEL